MTDWAAQQEAREEARERVGQGHFDFALDVAAALGWAMSPQKHGSGNPHLIGPNGATIALRFNGWNNEGRVRVFGTWPEADKINGGTEHFHPYQEKHEITCATSRGPAAVAKDISRRLLPDFLPAWDKQDERKTQFQNREIILTEATRQLGEIMGSISTGDGREYGQEFRAYSHGMNPSGHADASTYRTETGTLPSATTLEETSITFEIRNVPFPKALEIARLAWGKD